MGSILSLNGHYELIVVDDGSTDGTEGVVRSLGNNKINYIHIPHAGGPAARNAGLEAAKGDYIIWCGDDDAVKPWLLDEYSAALRADPSLVFASGDLEIITPAKSWVKDYRDCSVNPETVLGELLFTMQCTEGGAMFRKDIFTRLSGYNTAFPRAHDYEFFSRFFQCPPMRLRKIARPVYEYSFHGQGHLSSDLMGKDLRYDWAVVASLLDSYDLETLFPHLDLRLDTERAGLLRRLGQRMVDLGWFERGIACLQEAYAFVPEPQTRTHLQGLTAYFSAIRERLAVLQTRQAAGELDEEVALELRHLERFTVPLPSAPIPVPEALCAHPRKTPFESEELTVLRLSRLGDAKKNAVAGGQKIAVASAVSNPPVPGQTEECYAARRNKAMQCASAEWVLMAESGISLEPSALEKAAEVIARCPGLNAVFLEPGESGFPKCPALDIFDSPPSNRAYILHKYLWEKVGGFDSTLLPTLPEADVLVDWHFWIKASLSGLRYFVLQNSIKDAGPAPARSAPPWSAAFMRLLFQECNTVSDLLQAHEILSAAVKDEPVLRSAAASAPGRAAAYLTEGFWHEQRAELIPAKMAYLAASRASENRDWQPFLRLFLLASALNNKAEAARWSGLCLQLRPDLEPLLRNVGEHA